MSQEGDLVADGATFICPLCTSQLKLQVIQSSTTGADHLLANRDNFLFPPPEGQCLVSPLSPQPCTPSVQVLDPGQRAVQIDGKEALGGQCKLLCAKGGMLTLNASGQEVAKT